MSGIAGIIHFDGALVEPGLVEKMTNAMAYRGPDGINHWVQGSVGLGQCMLRTTPESLEENQPLTNEDESLVLVMDGRVDNWEELRRELLGHGAVLRNRSDAELVLRAYETWGRECLPHIDGDFALVIWDARRQLAFCARDRMGSKPFNYHWNGETFAFSSDLHPILLLPWIIQKPNEGMLSEFLAAKWYSSDETLRQGILRLVTAHRMEVGSGGPQLDQYWEPDLWNQPPYTTDEDYIEHYRQLFADSVRRLSRSHQPLAIEVSGGLDSSAVFSMAEHLRLLNRLPTPCIQGYTIAFTDDNRANELDYARVLGNCLDICIDEVSPSILSLSWFVERANTWVDFPGFANGTMAQNLLRQASLSGSRAILNGVGGDEWLSGSRVYYAEELKQRSWGTLYDCFRKDSSVFGAWQSLMWLLRYGFYPLTLPGFQHALRRIVRGLTGRRGNPDTYYWLSSHMQESIKLRHRSTLDHQVRCVGQRELLMTRHDAFLAIAREEAERLYAGFGLEVRRPLHTAEFVQYAFSTPERLRMRGDRDKYIHVQAMNRLMPQDILERKVKAEFSVMFRQHLDQMKDFFTETLPSERPEWVTRVGMKRLFQAYQDNPLAGWPMWILWSIYGCYIVL